MNILTSIDKGEVLRYLGHKGSEIDSRLNSLIDKCINEVLQHSESRFIYRQFALTDDLKLENTLYSLQGQDIKNHLSGCDKCILLALTLGIRIENLIRTTGVTDMAKSVILDSCATAAVESAADAVMEIIEKEYEGKYLTWRYSPGYGDLPLESQQDFAVLLDTNRKIGLSVTENNILLPRKSITAIIGISDEKSIANKVGCEACLIKEKCSFRKEGQTCEGKR